jgi:hypothetical protein
VVSERGWSQEHRGILVGCVRNSVSINVALYAEVEESEVSVGGAVDEYFIFANGYNTYLRIHQESKLLSRTTVNLIIKVGQLGSWRNDGISLLQTPSEHLNQRRLSQRGHSKSRDILAQVRGDESLRHDAAA